jgi:AraC-like DNA-binding protein
MVTRAMNVEAAAFEVGYESPSQFSREYARLFGAPPKQDLKRLQATFAERAVLDEALTRVAA